MPNVLLANILVMVLRGNHRANITSHTLILSETLIPKVAKHDLIWWCGWPSSIKTHLKGDKILLVIDAQFCDITTQISLVTKHVKFVMNLCLAASSTIVHKKHVPFEICLHFKAITKGNPLTIARQGNTFARNGRRDHHHVSKMRHY